MQRKMTDEFITKLDNISMIMGFNFSVISSKSRKKEVVNARQFLVRFLLAKRLSLTHVGEILNRNHATIINARKKLNGYLEFEKSLVNDYNCFAHKANLLWNNKRYRSMQIYNKREKWKTI